MKSKARVPRWIIESGCLYDKLTEYSKKNPELEIKLPEQYATEKESNPLSMIYHHIQFTIVCMRSFLRISIKLFVFFVERIVQSSSYKPDTLHKKF